MAGGLSMKTFGNEDKTRTALDLSGLDKNPNYKPEAQEGVQDTAQEGAQDVAPEVKEEIRDTPPVSEGVPDKTEGDKTPEVTGSQESDVSKESKLELTDELVQSYLSEKLGKEIDMNTLGQSTDDPFASDPYMKELQEWRAKTNRPIEDWVKFQKDYDKFDDLDIAREFLQIEYPTFNAEEINLELEQYVATDMDLDDESARKSLNLKKYAIKGRAALNELKGELGNFQAKDLSPEVQQKVQYADDIQKQISKSVEENASYKKGITSSAMSTESIKINLGGDLSLDFLMSEDERKSLPKTIETMPHWRKEDGSWNHQAVVEDGIKIKYFDKIVQMAFEQGQGTGAENVVKGAKNITLSKDGIASKGSGQDNTQKKGGVEGGTDKLFGRNAGLTMKFGGK